MKQRLNFYEAAPEVAKAMNGLHAYLNTSTLDKNLLHLVSYRVSQINGCAFCLDMHSKDLRAGGETEQRIYMISAWREAAIYTEKERAALAWAEAVTKLEDCEVPEEVYKAAAAHFSEKELVDLTLNIVAINGWNRFNIAFCMPSGHYVPGQFDTAH